MVKRTNRIWLLIIVVGLALFAGACSGNKTATPTPNSAAAGAPVKAEGRIVSDAKVMPVRYATLSLPTTGIVGEVLVQEGARVEQGRPLVRLAAPTEEAAVAQAEADVQKAQARVTELKAGPRDQDVASARAALDAARANLAKVQQGPRAEDVAAAQARVSAAAAGLKQTQEGATDQERIAAASDLSNAEASLRQAQSAYDQIKGQADVGLMPQSLNLQQATNAYNAAKARLSKLQAGPRSGDLAKAQAEVAAAQSALEVLKAPPRQAEVDAAQADVARAQAQLDLAQAGTRAETVAVAEADLASATAGLATAKAALTLTELKAPFAGTVAKIEVRTGEQVVPGTVMVRLADDSKWQIETTDLTELNVVRIHEGSPATVTFDALPDVKLPGKVVKINKFGENRQGDIVYTVVVAPDTQDERLRWNMTASVSVEPQS
jgi:HlyD family secretion protein